MHCSFQDPTAHEGELIADIDNICVVFVFDVPPDVVRHQDLQRSYRLRYQAADTIEIGVARKHHSIRPLHLFRSQRVVDHISKELETTCQPMLQGELSTRNET